MDISNRLKKKWGHWDCDVIPTHRRLKRRKRLLGLKTEATSQMSNNQNGKMVAKGLGVLGLMSVNSKLLISCHTESSSSYFMNHMFDLAKIVCQMHFMTQPSPFISALDWY